MILVLVVPFFDYCMILIIIVLLIIVVFLLSGEECSVLMYAVSLYLRMRVVCSLMVNTVRRTITMLGHSLPL